MPTVPATSACCAMAIVGTTGTGPVVPAGLRGWNASAEQVDTTNGVHAPARDLEPAGWHQGRPR